MTHPNRASRSEAHESSFDSLSLAQDEQIVSQPLGQHVSPSLNLAKLSAKGERVDFHLPSSFNDA